MPGPAGLPSQPARIIGREAGLARLRGLVEPVPHASQVLLVTGEAGMGKTVLLADAAGRARSAGMRVLSVTGRESESKLAFAGLHQLLRPVLSGTASLPGRQAQALLGALGLATDPLPPTRSSPRSPFSPCCRTFRNVRRSSWSPTTPSGLTAVRWTPWPSPAAASTPSRSCCLWAPVGRPCLPASTADSRNCILSRCPRQTPAACWTASLGHPGGEHARRCSHRQKVTPWR